LVRFAEAERVRVERQRSLRPLSAVYLHLQRTGKRTFITARSGLVSRFASNQTLRKK
jgi:hypothetical protein